MEYKPVIINFNIEKWHLGCESAFSSTWDDMTMTSIYGITDIANKLNIKTTIYINGENKEWKTKLFYGNDLTPKTPLILNENIKNRLLHISNNGNEIGNHTYSHISLKNNSQGKTDSIIKNIQKCNQLITSITGQKEFTFCYPFGHTSSDKKVNNFLINNFISCRLANYGKNRDDEIQYLNKKFNKNLFSIHVGPYPYEKKLAELNYLLDKSITQKSWLIEYGHGWDNDAWCPAKKENMIEHFKYINSKANTQVWCDTVINISKYMIQFNQVTLQTTLRNNKYEISFHNTKFNFIPVPMTISFISSVPIAVEQNNKKLEIYQNKKKQYFIINNFSDCIITYYL